MVVQNICPLLFSNNALWIVSLILLKDVWHCSRAQRRTGIIVIVSDEVCWKRSGWRSWQFSGLAFLLLPSVSTWSLLHYREDKKNEAVVVFGGDFFPSLWLTLEYTLSRWMKLRNCSKLLLDSTHNYQHIQLVFKNVPPSTIFLHLFLWGNSNCDDKNISLSMGNLVKFAI